MSINLIEQKTKDPKLQEDLIKVIFDNLNTNMKLKNAKTLVKNGSFPIEFEYKKSHDVFKMRLLIHNCLVELDKLVRNYLSNSSDNPFVTLYEEFLGYCKEKIIRLKGRVSDLKAMHIKQSAKIKKMDSLNQTIKEMLKTPISSKDSRLISENKTKGASG